jgi:hypothetical protein
MGDDRQFVVVWQNTCWNCLFRWEESNVIGRRFDYAGNPLASEFQVNTYTTGDYQGQAVVAMDKGSDFVVAWASGPRQHYGRMYLHVAGQRFDSAGNPVSGEFRVGVGRGMLPSVTFDRKGEFVVVWSSGDASPYRQEDHTALRCRRQSGRRGVPGQHLDYLHQ